MRETAVLRKTRLWKAAPALLLAFLLCIPYPAAAVTPAAPVSMKDATGALLAEAGTQQVLMEESADTARSVAGLSKLPAILVLCEAVDQGKLDLKSDIAVSRNAASVPGPTAFIEGGEIVPAENLIKAACMICAGDAVVALGEALFGTETAFVDQINARLKELGIGATLANATGQGTELSPRQLGILGAALMQSPCFAARSKLTLESFTHADGRETELVNANRMLRSYAGCGGVTTGSSAADGYCGVFFVTRGDTQLVCVVLGCKNASSRFALASAMLDQAFATKKAQKLAKQGDVLAENVRVHGGKQRSVDLVAKDTVVLLLDKSAPALVTVEDIPDQLDAPLAATDVVGSISYRTPDGAEVGKVELVPAQDVEQAFLSEIIRDLLLSFIRQ